MPLTLASAWRRHLQDKTLSATQDHIAFSPPLPAKICRHFRPQHRGVLFISPKLYINIESFSDVIKTHTVQLIVQHTSIPVPRVYYALRQIVIERIDGEMMGGG